MFLFFSLSALKKNGMQVWKTQQPEIFILTDQGGPSWPLKHVSIQTSAEYKTPFIYLKQF